MHVAERRNLFYSIAIRELFQWTISTEAFGRSCADFGSVSGRGMNDCGHGKIRAVSILKNDKTASERPISAAEKNV
jgi:hypothetical protein